jgi:hypothetical protein
MPVSDIIQESERLGSALEQILGFGPLFLEKGNPN